MTILRTLNYISLTLTLLGLSIKYREIVNINKTIKLSSTIIIRTFLLDNVLFIIYRQCLKKINCQFILI